MTTLTWRGPVLMLFARSACAVGAQAVVATVFALRSSPTPWRDAGPWLLSAASLSGSLPEYDPGGRVGGVRLVVPARRHALDFRCEVHGLSPVPHTLFATLVYLRLRRVVPLAIAHALMDGASVLIGVLLPLLRA
jgi:hypothetical protein